jgi:hypothetical protein
MSTHPVMKTYRFVAYFYACETLPLTQVQTFMLLSLDNLYVNYIYLNSSQLNLCCHYLIHNASYEPKIEDCSSDLTM